MPTLEIGDPVGAVGDGNIQVAAPQAHNGPDVPRHASKNNSQRAEPSSAAGACQMPSIVFIGVSTARRVTIALTA
jgi:hypothetical protein